jgi:ClpP class serine protease
MPYPKILSKIEAMRWAIMPGSLRGIIRAVEEGLTPEDYELFHRISEEERTALVADLGTRIPNTTHSFRNGQNGIIFVDGPIVPRATALASASGITSYQSLTADFLALEKDPRVKNIVLLFDSPGGAVTGTSDFANMVAASKKHTIGYVYGMCASAAYWVGSACNVLYSVDTGLLGALGIHGTYRLRKPDSTETTLEIFSSQTPNKRVDLESESTQAHLQQNANDLCDVFLGAVASNMGVDLDTVIDDFGGGAALVAMPALEAGMIHGIAPLSDVLSGFTAQAGRNRPPSVTQTLIFNKAQFPKRADAVAWAQKHKYRADKVDETENSFRLRQRDPGEFRNFATITLTEGVKAVIGQLKRTATRHAARAAVASVQARSPKPERSARQQKIDGYRDKIAKSNRQKKGSSNSPAIAGKQGEFDNMDPVLAALMADDPAIANAIRALEAEAFAKGQTAGEQKMKSRIDAATPYLAEDKKKASYPASVRKVAMQVLAGQMPGSALVATVAAVDAVTEGKASDQAAAESEAVGDIPPQTPDTGAGATGEWKGYMDDAEFEAEVKRVRGQKGLGQEV